MKKIVCLSLILLITVCLTSSVFAASCKIDLKPSKSEISKGEEFTVDVIVKDIDAVLERSELLYIWYIC